MVTFETIRQIVLALMEAEESTWFGTPSFKVGAKSFARLRDDGTVLVVRTEMEIRDALMQTRPDTYFITPHYEGHPYLLVRLDRADPHELADLLTDAWDVVAPKRLTKQFEPPG